MRWRHVLICGWVLWNLVRVGGDGTVYAVDSFETRDECKAAGERVLATPLDPRATRSVKCLPVGVTPVARY
jgi:hypothetical protein